MADSSIKTNIQSETKGQLAVGNYIIKIGSIHGAIANIATTKEIPAVRLRSTPVFMEPPCDKLPHHRQLVTDAIAALESGQSVEFYSPPGFGKTVLLRSLAHNQQVTSLFGDGVISLCGLHSSVDDLLWFIWEAFYESDIPYKPTRAQIRQQIQDKQALIVLDDDQLIQDEIQELMNAAQKCKLLLASPNSRIRKKGRCIQLSGLAIGDALILVERELQRSLKPEEMPAARSLCTILKGHPMHLRLAVASILDREQSLAELVSILPTWDSGKYLIQQILASLTKPQTLLLELLAVMGSVGLESQMLADILQLADAHNTLESLRKLHLVERNHRYSLNKSVLEVLPQKWKLTAALESAIAYFTTWAEQHQQQPKILLSQIDALAQIIEVAVKASRWQDVLRLVKAIENPLALSRRSGLWAQMLQRALQASQAELDQATQAWALHQLGTVALCLAEYHTATQYYTTAIELRQSLGDEMGVSATRHNLNLLKAQQDTASEPSLKTKLQLEKSQIPLARMNIVVENTNVSKQHGRKNVLLSPRGLITTGILASGGLLALFNWHRLTPVAPTSPKLIKQSPKATPTPKATATTSPIAEPTPTGTATLSPITQPKETPPAPPPVIKSTPIKLPIEEFQTPTARTKSRANKPKSQITPLVTPIPTSAPPTPEPTPTAEPEGSPPEPTPTLTSEQQSLQPTPTLTPTAEPSQQSLQPTPTLTPVPTRQGEIVATPAVTVTPIEESQKLRN